jgi:hypothetical protein
MTRNIESSLAFHCQKSMVHIVFQCLFFLANKFGMNWSQPLELIVCQYPTRTFYVWKMDLGMMQMFLHWQKNPQIQQFFLKY